MKLPNATHESHFWRIHEIVPDFILEDVWALPAEGDAEDFEKLLGLLAAADPSDAESAATRFSGSCAIASAAGSASAGSRRRPTGVRRALAG
jgi:hypothetical protein